MLKSEVGPDPDFRSGLRQDSAFFSRTRIRTQSQKFRKKRIRSRFPFLQEYVWSFLNSLGPGFTPFFAELCNPITRQAIEQEIYPNHPRIQQVFHAFQVIHAFSKKKNVFRFRRGISGGDVTKKACFWNFARPWDLTHWPLLLAQSFVENEVNIRV